MQEIVFSVSTNPIHEAVEDVFLLKTYIISGRNGNLRNLELLRLVEDPFFEVEIVPSDFFEILPEAHDAHKAFLIYGQKLSLPEIGCASSHVKAYRQQIQNEYQWALVLEDDAIIENLAGLKSLEREITKRETTTPEVISLYFHDTVIFPNYQNGSLTKVFGYPVGAVAYFINLSAAKKFNSLNTNLIFKADWPRSKEISFLASKNQLIRHPENRNSSYIEVHRKRDRALFSLLRKFRDFTFLTYIGNLNHFVDIHDYKEKLINPSFYFWLGRFRSKPMHDGHGNRMLNSDLVD